MKAIHANFLLLSLSIALVFAACGPKETTGEVEGLRGRISLSGAFALYPLVNVWAQEFNKEHPGVRFNISAGGAGKGMTDVLAGAVDLAMFSKEISAAESGKGAFGIAVAKDAVVPTASDQNPILARLKAEGMKRGEFSALFLSGRPATWKDTAHEMIVFTRSDACGAAEVWVKYLGGKAQEELKGIAVFGDPGVAAAVADDPRAIGFNNVNYVYDVRTGQKYPGLEVIPIDLNENGQIDPEEDFYGNLGDLLKAIGDGRYPSPPARNLYLVSKGRPTSPVVRAFLEWALTRGQAYVLESGYNLLDPQTIELEMKKLQQ